LLKGHFTLLSSKNACFKQNFLEKSKSNLGTFIKNRYLLLFWDLMRWIDDSINKICARLRFSNLHELSIGEYIYKNDFKCRLAADIFARYIKTKDLDFSTTFPFDDAERGKRGKIYYLRKTLIILIHKT